VTPPYEPSVLEEEARYLIGEGPAKVVSISMPEGTLHALRKLVGKRGLSAAVTATMEKRLRDEAFDQDLAEYVKEHGDFTDEERAQSRAILAEAMARDAAWRAAHS